MDFNLYHKVITEISNLNPKAVTLHLSGEPLLHPRISHMVRLAVDSSLFVQFSTNAMLLNTETAEALVDAGLRAIRIDFCADEATFEKIRVGASWCSVRDNIRGLLAAKAARNSFHPEVTVVDLTPDAPDSAARLASLFSEHPSYRIEGFQSHTWAGQFADEAVVNSNHSPAASYYPCSHAWSGMAIRWDGSVVPCCRDLLGDYIVGNVQESTLLAIWNGKRLIALRTLLRERRYTDIRLCRSCTKLWEGKPYHLIGRHAAFLWHKVQSRLARFAR